MYNESTHWILPNPSDIGPLESYTHQGVVGVSWDGIHMKIILEVASGEGQGSEVAALTESAAIMREEETGKWDAEMRASWVY